MGQRGEPPSEATSDAVEASPLSFVERHFWSILAGAVLFAGGAGATVAITQYEAVDRTVRSIPYAKQAVDNVGRMASTVPLMGADTSGQKVKYGSFTRMEGLVVNPAGSDGSRYLAVSIAFESKAEGIRAEMEQKKVVVKDAILTHLSEQTVKDLSNPDRRKTLKTELIEETNSILTSGSIDRLYFTEFVLQ